MSSSSQVAARAGGRPHILVLDWTLALLFRRELVALGRLQDPRVELQAAAQERPGG